MGVSYLQYAKGLFRPKRLESAFLFVTSSCNSHKLCILGGELERFRVPDPMPTTQ